MADHSSATLSSANQIPPENQKANGIIPVNATFTGPWTTDKTVTITFKRKYPDVVIMNIPSICGYCVNKSIISSVGPCVPESFRQLAKYNYCVIDSGKLCEGHLYMDPDGTIKIFRARGRGFTIGGDCGMDWCDVYVHC